MPCKSKQALMRGMRPQHQQKIQCGVCSGRCIYCDIWNLATLLFTRVPISNKYASPLSSKKLSRSSRADLPTHRETFDWEASERMIEAQFQTQRARLASIMSICTVEGADESEGLWVAYDRCLRHVQELLYQEKILEETIIRSSRDHISAPTSSRRLSMQRRTSRDCGNVNSNYYHNERRSSRVGIAM